MFSLLISIKYVVSCCGNEILSKTLMTRWPFMNVDGFFSMGAFTLWEYCLQNGHLHVKIYLNSFLRVTYLFFFFFLSCALLDMYQICCKHLYMHEDLPPFVSIFQKKTKFPTKTMFVSCAKKHGNKIVFCRHRVTTQPLLPTIKTRIVLFLRKCGGLFFFQLFWQENCTHFKRRLFLALFATPPHKHGQASWALCVTPYSVRWLYNWRKSHVIRANVPPPPVLDNVVCCLFYCFRKFNGIVNIPAWSMRVA